MEEKILNWLNTQGYPLEMRVASAFHGHELDVRQSVYYEDPDEGKSREIDVVAETAVHFPRMDLLFSFAVECKLSSEKPWLLFGGSTFADSVTSTLSQSMACSKGVADSVALAVKDEIARHCSIFSGDRLSHGLTAAFSTGPDVPYRAVMTAIKAAHWLTNRKLRDATLVAFAVPVVVIDTKLYDAFLDERGDLAIREVKSGTVRLQASVGDVISPWVKVVTANAVDEFVSKATKMAGMAMNRIFLTLTADGSIPAGPDGTAS